MQARRRQRRNMLVQYEQPNQHVALIRLNRPEKMNAFSTGLERDLLTALQRACGDEEVRVVVFAGGGKAFSGGWDLAESDLTDPEYHPLSGRRGVTHGSRSCGRCVGPTRSSLPRCMAGRRVRASSSAS